MEEKILKLTHKTLEKILWAFVSIAHVVKRRRFFVETRLKAIQQERDQKLDRLLDSVSELMRDERKDEKKREKAARLFDIEMKKRLKEKIGKCEKCHRRDLKLTLDHIIPKYVLFDFGVNAFLNPDERNVRLLCNMCNLKKGNHLDFTDYRTKPLLLELLKNQPGPDDFKSAKLKQEDLVSQNYLKLLGLMVPKDL